MEGVQGEQGSREARGRGTAYWDEEEDESRKGAKTKREREMRE